MNTRHLAAKCLSRLVRYSESLKDDDLTKRLNEIGPVGAVEEIAETLSKELVNAGVPVEPGEFWSG